MPLAEVQGQARAVEALRSAIRSNTVHHAYLFAGPEGVGKELAATGFVQALLCSEAPSEGCGMCSVCQRVLRRNHPDVTWLMPDAEQVERGLAGRSDFDGTPSREVRVEQIRKLQERLSLHALEAPRKVALVCSAEQMNVQAQNAFLKTLEEPPRDTTLILIASAPDKLLPTIRSRCSKVHFGPLTPELIAERISTDRKLDPVTARTVALLAGGSLSRARSLDVEGLARRSEVIARFEEASASGIRGVLRFAEEFGASRDDAEDALDILLLWTRDLALTRAGVPVGGHGELEALARTSAEALSDGRIHRRQALITRTRELISTRNASPRLQLEKLLIELMEAA